MVDLLQNNVYVTQDNNLPQSKAYDDGSLICLTTLRRYSQEQKQKRYLAREADANIRDEQLFHIKDKIPEIHATGNRPFMGLCCQNCTFTSRSSLVKMTTEKLALINVLNDQFCLNRNEILWRTFPHIYQVSNLKKFHYPQVAHLVLKDERILKAVETTVSSNIQNLDNNEPQIYQELIIKNQSRAKRLLLNMRSTLSDFALKVSCWVLHKLFPCFLDSIVVHPGQVKMLKESSKSNLPLIFLPLHRSNLDYLLLMFILVNNNVQSPLFGMKDNLRISFIGSILRRLGAFFIRGKVDPVMGSKDHVYQAVLHTYVNLSLRAGHNIGFFMEGEQTRTGRPSMPKYSLLGIILESFMDGTIEDALLIPVSVNYEKLVDGNFIKEQLGEIKKVDTFWSSVRKIWQVINNKFGMTRVEFAQPFSLRELIGSFDSRQKNISVNINRTIQANLSTSSLYGTYEVSDEQKTLVLKLSKHIIYDCSQLTPIMSTNALAFLLLNKYRKGGTLEQLALALSSLKEELEFARKDVGFSGDPVDVVNYAVNLLGPALVRKEKQNGKDVIKPVSVLPNVIELSYYSNILVGHFALESIVALALSVSEIRLDTVSHNDLIENALELCNMFQYEFLFCKPCQDLEQTITSSIEDLSVRKEIFITEENSEIIKMSRKLAAQFEDNEEEVFQKIYKLNNTKQTLENISLLGNTLMPLIETYAVTAFTLDKLVQRQLLESELISDVLSEMKNQLERESLKFSESVAVEPIKNALKLYQKWGVLECHNEDGLKLYYLNESYDDSESVQDLYAKVTKYRRQNLFFSL